MTAFLAVVVDPGAEPVRVEWTLDDQTCLSALQAAVGGYVDVVRLTDTLDMWVNDEGAFTADLNPLASAIASVYSARTGTMRQPFYYGPVVFTGGADAEGAAPAAAAGPVRRDRRHRSPAAGRLRPRKDTAMYDDVTYDEDAAPFDLGWCPRCGADMAGEPPAALICGPCDALDEAAAEEGAAEEARDNEPATRAGRP